MTHKGDLDARLENWAKAQRYSSAAGSVIGSAEGRYRGDNPESRSIDAMLLDEADADAVQRAWRRLLEFDRDVLRMHYILCMDPRIICRKIRIPHRPANTFYMALAHAKKEIARALESIEATRRAQIDRHRAAQAEVDAVTMVER